MLDVNYVRENFDLVREKLATRNFDVALLEPFAQLDVERRALVRERDDLNATTNRVSKEIGNLMREGKREEAEALKAQSKQASERAKEIEARLSGIEEELRTVLTRVPNLPHESVPAGKDEAANTEVRRWGTPRDFAAEGFTPKDHVDVATALGILDLERATKITGARFNVLSGLGAKLERALINFMLDLHTGEHGYREILPPLMVNEATLFGTGQLPKFEEDLFKVRFERDYYLIPTAEVPVTNLHRDEILNGADLPLSYTAYTPCFRSEAGSYGRDTRGLIRQHQFHKVELMMFAHPEKSYEMHERLTSDAEKILERLELPYRRMLLCTGDIGFGAAKCYDLEVWLPGAQAYREISSCSNFEDFQARRADIRFRPAGGGKPQYVHTLNGSGLAVGRTLIAVMENYQQEDGRIAVPKVLQKYMGTEWI